MKPHHLQPWSLTPRPALQGTQRCTGQLRSVSFAPKEMGFVLWGVEALLKGGSYWVFNIYIYIYISCFSFETLLRGLFAFWNIMFFEATRLFCCQKPCVFFRGRSPPRHAQLKVAGGRVVHGLRTSALAAARNRCVRSTQRPPSCYPWRGSQSWYMEVFQMSGHHFLDKPLISNFSLVLLQEDLKGSFFSPFQAWSRGSWTGVPANGEFTPSLIGPPMPKSLTKTCRFQHGRAEKECFPVGESCPLLH